MKYDGYNLKEVLKAHERWLKKSEGWAECDKADLRGACLRGANIENAELARADLRGAFLAGSYLARSCLRKADLTGADLRGACLIGADLRGAFLKDTDLRGALLMGANLAGADLRRAIFEGSDLRGAEYVPFVPMVCPDTGSFVAWKTCLSEDGTRVIVKLLIPDDAKRTSSTSRKCRADKAIVQEIQTIDGEPLENVKARSVYDSTFTYSVGETVRPEKPFCEDRWQECESGIHFFINRQEAVDYYG